MAYTWIDYNLIIEYLKSSGCLYILSAFLFVLAVLFILNKRKKRKKLFYSTGFKLICSAWDRLKFKIRLADYDDTKGIRYSYLISFKVFCWEFYRVKYTDQKGKVYKRKLRFGGIK